MLADRSRSLLQVPGHSDADRTDARSREPCRRHFARRRKRRKTVRPRSVAVLEVLAAENVSCFPKFMTGRVRPLRIIERAPNSPEGEARWQCRCVCGNETTLLGKTIRKGNTTSCGCGRTGRPAAPSKQIGVRGPLAQLAKINAWVKRQPDRLTLPEALRRLAGKAIDDERRRAR